MTKRVLGDGASCCGVKDCELCSDTPLTYIPSAAEAEPSEDLDPFDEEDDE